MLLNAFIGTGEASRRNNLYLLDPLKVATTSFSETNFSICAPSASPYFAFSSLRARSDVLRSLIWSWRTRCEAEQECCQLTVHQQIEWRRGQTDEFLDRGFVS